MPKFAPLVKLVKKYAKDPGISDEAFLNAFINAYIVAGDVVNKKGEELHFDKTQTSLLLNQKSDIHQNIRKALYRLGITEDTEDGMSAFVEDYLNAATTSNLYEELQDFLKQDGGVPNAQKDNLFSKASGRIEILLADIQIMSLSEDNREAPKPFIIWKNGSNVAETITGDIFQFGFDNRKKKKNIVVIPVNTAFDTHVTRKLEGNPRPIVSENTIHGQWLSRMEQSDEDMELLGGRIVESLKSLGYDYIKVVDHANGNSKQFEIGSIAVIETDNAVYFLSAVSEFDEFNNAQSSPEKIDISIRSILRMYDKVGQGYDLYIPLIGTGRSRAGLSIKGAYALLTRSIVENGDLIHGHIYLVLRPEDRNEIELQEEN